MKIYEILSESVAGPEKCCPGHRKVGTKPGTGKNAGKRVNDCEKIGESEIERQHGDLKPWAYWNSPERVAQKLYKIHGGEPIGKDEVKHLWKVDGPDRITKFMLKPDMSAILSNYQAMSDQGPLFKEDIDADQLFDQIEEMVEAWAEAHGVDPEQIWEDFESVDDQELLDEAAAWRTSKGKSKSGGLNAKGVASYRRENPGSKLQMAVTTKPSKLKKGSKAAKRRKSFCARMGGVKGPMKKPNGKPTRKALALRKWNC